MSRKKGHSCVTGFQISIKLLVIWALHCVMAFKLVSSCSIRNGTFQKWCAHQLRPSWRIQTLSWFKNIFKIILIYWDCKFITFTVRWLWWSRGGALVTGHQLRSAQVPLDVQGQVVRPRERSAADVAFERLDSGVFPLRGCSDNKWKNPSYTFIKYFQKLQ